MWKFGVLLIMPLILLTACQKDGMKRFFKLEFSDGTVIFGKPRIVYKHRSDSPCFPDTCFSLVIGYSHNLSTSQLLVDYIPLEVGVFQFSQIRSLVPRQEREFYSIQFYPRYPAIHKNDPEAWNSYLAIEDDFNEFVITRLDRRSGKVEGHFRVNLMKYPAGYLHTGGWPPGFVSDTIQIAKGTFSGVLEWR
jgi:hypothetical protein